MPIYDSFEPPLTESPPIPAECGAQMSKEKEEARGAYGAACP
ncbi:hypothetical protein [Streptomyces sp. NPDC002403]